MPYHTVVVGYDGSGDADRAVEAAAIRSRRTGRFTW
jgi:hypothetical protein